MIYLLCCDFVQAAAEAVEEEVAVKPSNVKKEGRAFLALGSNT